MEYWDAKCEYYKEMMESMRSGGYSQEMDGEYRIHSKDITEIFIKE